MYTKLNKYLILILVLFYLLFNVYIRKYYNILIFIIMFFCLNNFIKDKTTILITIYCIIITISIIKHFHLLENFESESTPKHNVIKKSTNKKKISTEYKEIIEDLSDNLIMKYIKKTKQDNPTKISTRKVILTDLIPTKSELSSSKIKGISNNKKELAKPIVITNDNFIIDGHHRWYIQKSKHKSTSNSDTDFITCIIINNTINKFLNSITRFKQEYNSNTLDNFKIDKSKIEDTKKAINTIKKNINIIEKYNNELNKLNVI